MWPLNGLRFSATLSGQYVAAARKSHSATLMYHPVRASGPPGLVV